ncbi:MAG: DUF177 domain-containing protein [Bdellovibrionales bacterium]|nr:DUF177 domain-containing protein [Bdellovibrionales bacterium]
MQGNLQVRLSDIPVEGIIINDTIPLETLNARMNEGPGNDVQFLAPPTVSLTISPRKGSAELSGTVTATYRQNCPRCLEVIDHPISQELNIILKAKELRPGTDRKLSAEEWDDDIGIIYFDGEHIDLEDIVQETLILAIDPLGAPHDGCSPMEWKDDPEEEKNTLGKLFQKVGLN